MYIIFILINSHLNNLLYITPLFMLQYTFKECVSREKSLHQTHTFANNSPIRQKISVGLNRRRFFCCLLGDNCSRLRVHGNGDAFRLAENLSPNADQPCGARLKIGSRTILRQHHIAQLNR